MAKSYRPVLRDQPMLLPIDHATIARCRAEARDAFTDLFSQVQMIAAGAGLGRFGTVAIDGTKIAANASIDAKRGKEWFDRRVAGMVADSEGTDRAEDTGARGAHDAGWIVFRPA